MSLLYNFNQSTVTEKVTMKWPSDEYIIPAGTPMSRTGIANDGNAIGILASEARLEFPYPLEAAKYVGKEEPKGKRDYTFSIITSGFVNLTDAEEAFGEKISDAAKKAMEDINFVNEDEPSSFGGSGGGDLPFGEEGGEIFKLENVKFEASEGYSGYTISSKPNLENAKMYTVVFDGVEYKCTALVDESGEYLGNLGMFTGVDTGEPFAYIGNPDGTAIIAAFTDAVGATHSFIITDVVITPLPTKYLPEEVATKSFVEELIGGIENGTY